MLTHKKEDYMHIAAFQSFNKRNYTHISAICCISGLKKTKTHNKILLIGFRILFFSVDLLTKDLKIKVGIYSHLLLKYI